MDAKNTMHVKAALDGEIRRFQCQTSFDVLESTVRRLFLIPTGQVITLKYLDDENDHCIVSSQLELDYALSLPTNCLKLTLATQKTPAPDSQPPETPKEAEKPPQKPAGWWQQHLENRLSWITQKLEQPDLPPHKREKLTARKQWIEAKIAQKVSAETGGQTEQPQPFWRFHPGPWGVPQHSPPPHVGPWGVPHPGPWGVIPHHPPPPHVGPWGAPDIAYAHPPPVFVGAGWGGCRGMRGGGNLEHRLNWIKAKLEQPDLPQHKVDRLTARKEMLQAKLNAQQQQASPGQQQTPAPCGPWQQKIENRLAWITVKLEQPNLPPHKIEKLRRRKEFLQAKLEQKKSADQTPTTPPALGPCATPAPGGFLQTKLDWINFKLQQPNLPPQKLERLTNRKKMIEAKLAQQQGCGGRC